MNKKTHELIHTRTIVRLALRKLARNMNLDLYFDTKDRADVIGAVFIRDDQYYHIVCNLNEVTDINKAIDGVREYMETFSGSYLTGGFIIEDKDKSSIYPIENDYFKIKKVIFNDLATVVIWCDGSKTVVKCQDGDTFNKEKGLAMAISKRALGDKGRYCEEFKKWIPEINDEVTTASEGKTINPYSDAMKAMKKLGESLKQFNK